MMKKGAIQLSTTAIVSIILAFVFLGLVITFTRSIFDQGTNQLDQFWATVNINQKASPDNPVLFPEKVTIKWGKSQDFGIRVYNTLQETLENTKPIIKECVDENGDEVSGIIFITNKADIPPGGEQGFTGKIKAPKPEDSSEVNVRPGNYVCAVVVTADGHDPYVTELPQGNLIVMVTV